MKGRGDFQQLLKIKKGMKVLCSLLEALTTRKELASGGGIVYNIGVKDADKSRAKSRSVSCIP